MQNLDIHSLTQHVSLRAGGVRDAVKGLAKGLTKAGNSFTLYGVRDNPAADDAENYSDLDLQLGIEIGPSQFGYNFGLKRLLRKNLLGTNKPSVLELHGLWMYKSIVADHVSKKMGIPLIIHTHGHLDSWALRNKSLQKKIAYFIYEKSTLQQASAIRTLCNLETEHVRKLGLGVPIAEIPNGIDLPSQSIIHHNPFAPLLSNSSKFALYMARITPQKGLDVLLQAWASSGMKAHMKLVVAGPNYGGFEEKMKVLANQLGIMNSVVFLGPIHGADKDALLSMASLFILPSYSEGFSMSLLEASCYKLPIIYTHACNFPELNTKAAGRLYPTESSAISNALKDFNQTSDQMKSEEGQKNYDFITKNYTWDILALKYQNVLEWILKGMPANNVPEEIVYYPS